MTRSLRLGRKNGARTGIAAVEFALVLPFLMLILFGVWEIGRLIQVTQIISNSAREGGRQCATGNMSASDLTTTGTAYQILQRGGKPFFTPSRAGE